MYVTHNKGPRGKYRKRMWLDLIQRAHFLKETRETFVILINFIDFASRCQRACKYRLLNSKSFFFFVGFFWSSVWFCFLTKLRAPEVINSAAYKPQKYQFYIIKYCTYKTFTKHRYKITASFVPSSQIAPFRRTVCYTSPCFRDTLWHPSFVRSFKAGLEKTSARLPTPAIQFKCAQSLDAPVHPQIWFQRREGHVGL